MNSALRTSRLRKNAIPGLGRAGLQPRRKSRPNIYNKLSCGRRYGGAESPALPRLEIPFFSNLLVHRPINSLSFRNGKKRSSQPSPLGRGYGEAGGEGFLQPTGERHK